MADFSKIRDLGVARSVLEGKSKSPLSDLLTGKMNELVDALKKRIDYHDADASGSLKASVSPTKVNVNNGVVNVTVDANYYWKFINYGVNGTKNSWGAPTWGQQKSTGKTFKDLIGEWIRYRGIKPQAYGKAKLSPSAYEGLNYVIRRSIKEKGIEPRPFVEEVMTEQLQQSMADEVSQLVGRAVEVILQVNFE